MKVTCSKGKVHSVVIEGSFTGPFIDLHLSPKTAYELLLALEAIHADLVDMTTNYHDCAECGETHPNDVQGCPTLGEGEEALDLPGFDTFCQELDQDQRPEGSAF